MRKYIKIYRNINARKYDRHMVIWYDGMKVNVRSKKTPYKLLSSRNVLVLR